MSTDYQVEKRLAELDKDLHDRYRNCVVTTPNMLTRYEGAFPSYTDHSTLHTLEIIGICNQLIGAQLPLLTADDLYVLLMSALLHDVGMGISKRDFESFKQRLDLPNQNPLLTGLEWSELIREHHQEFSAFYVEQYVEFLDIPSRQHMQAIAQVCRGHRKTDLMDEMGYPSEMELSGNRLIHLPYLAALICLADELDVAADRNIGFLYDIGNIGNPVSRMEFLKHQAIRKVEIEPESVIVYAYSDDADVREGIIRLSEKLDDKLRYCRTVVAMRTELILQFIRKRSFWNLIGRKTMNLWNQVFHLDEHGTTVRRELIGALTSFFAIAYIIFVTPGYLSQTGMDYTAVLIASCVAAAMGCFLSAIFGFPFILTPGVGLNAFFTYTLCFTMGYTWQQGLAVVFISGLLYLLISVTPLRELMISCIPPSMKNAISAGLGLFISLIGLFNAGLVTAENGNMTLGPVTAPNVFLAIIGMLITGVLMAWKVKGAMLIGIVVTTLIGIPIGVTQMPEHITLSGISMAPVLFQIDFRGMLSLGILPLVSAVVTFTMCLCFDTLGDIICIAGAGNMLETDGSIGKNSRVMKLNAVGTCFSCVLGGPALIPPVEGATGIAEGARTGLHSVVVGGLFLLSILIAPIAGLIPNAATAPSLILIGMLMIGNASNIYWHNLEIALPCFLTMIMIPFTYSVADGIGMGFISYVGIHLITGKWRKVPFITYILAGMFVAMYILSAL